MRILDTFKSVITESYSVAESTLGQEVQKIVLEKKDQLINSMEKDRFIKVPFVGDFSSGKSSLINAMIGKKEFLPTGITPLTAVSYELYYDVNERLEHWRGGQIRDTLSLEQIRDMKVEAGDIVKVFIDNEQVKKWNEKNIVVVDMPGIDSGLQEHNDAIMHYIEEGTCFVIATEVVQGTLRNSTIDFLKEVQQYNLSAYITITKADKFDADNIISVQNLITKQADLYLKGTKTGISSSVNNQFSDVLNFIDSIDVEEIFKKKYQLAVESFSDTLIKDIKNEYSLLTIDKDQLANKKAALLAQYEATQRNLEIKKNEAYLKANSADDILDAVENALKNKSRNFANIILQNKTDLHPFNTELTATIRPVIITNLDKEAEEYIHIIGEIATDFQTKANVIISENNAIIDELNKYIPQVEDLLKNNLGKLGTQLLSILKLSKFLKITGPQGALVSAIVSQLLEFAINNILKLFGKSSEQIAAKVESVFVEKVIPSIIDNMRPEIEKMVDEQQRLIAEAIENEVKQQRDMVLAQIQEAEEQQKVSEEEANAQREKLETIVKEILEIKKRVA